MLYYQYNNYDVPAGVFFIQIPDYATIFSCSAFFITFILCFKQVVQKPIRRIVLTALSLLVIIISILGNYCNPYWNSINFKENISDLRLRNAALLVPEYLYKMQDEAF